MEPRRALSVSKAQREYLAKEKRHRSNVLITRFLLMICMLAGWEAGSRMGWIDDFIFSSPSLVLHCFWGMLMDGSILGHIGITLLETLVSFAAVTLIGIAAALFLWIFRTVTEVIEPYLVMLNSLPKSALAPLLIVWLGSNVRTIVIAAVSVAVFGSVLTLYTGFAEVDMDQIRLIESLGGRKKDVLFKVLLPASIPMLISNMKVNIGLCLVGVMIGEFLAARAGLGFLIIYSSQVFKMDVLMMAIVLLCILSAVLYRAITWVERIIHKVVW